MPNRIAAPFCYGRVVETQRRKTSIGSGGNHCVSICIDGCILLGRGLCGVWLGFVVQECYSE